MPRPLFHSSLRIGLACLAVAVVPSFSSAADEDAADGIGRVSVRGFGTVGAARSTSDQADFVRDLSQPRGIGITSGGWSGRVDTILGLQANWQARKDLQVVGQLVSRYGYDASFRPDLMWAFVKWDPNQTLSLRAGRLGTDFFMLSDSRLVGYSNLTVRPSVDYFGALPFSYIEGADGTATVATPAGILRGKLFAGYSREKAPLANQLWNLDGSFMRGGHVDFQTGPWQVRAGIAKLRFKHDLPAPVDQLVAQLRLFGAADAANALAVEGKDSRFASLGVVYDSGPLQVQLMLSDTKRDSIVFQDSRAGYLLAGYRVGPFTPYAGYSWVRSTAKSLDAPLPAPFVPLVNSLLADSHSHQHTNTLGLRWDFRTNTALKLQWDAVRGDSDNVFLYRRETAAWTGRTNVFSATVDFVF